MPLADWFDALRWWVVLLALGALALPVTFTLFGRLPERGYAFSKVVGLLIVGYVFWLLATLGFLRNDLAGILVAVLALAGLSAAALRYSGGGGPAELRRWLAEHRRYVLAAELVFAAVFWLWVWVRAQNPAIQATEKPMEFAFLNSAIRSPSYPPLDPWMSGFAISYYYFGYVMTSILARLSAVRPEVAFNLAIAWLIAGTALGSFGIAANLVALSRRALGRAAIAFGLLAAAAVPLAGNLEIGLELLHANGAGSAAFWEWLDVRELNGPPDPEDTPRYQTSAWWWWRSSRVIHEYHLSGRTEEGLEPIAEFPAFSFVLGDLHPHVLALPFAFLGLAVALAWWLEAADGELDLRFWRSDRPPEARLRGGGRRRAVLFAFSALALGGLSFLNTWDVLIYMFLIVGAYALGRWRATGVWDRSLLGRAAAFAVALALPAILLYLPFYLGFRSQAGPPFLLPMTVRPTRLAYFLIIFGMPILVIGAFLIVGAVLESRLLPGGEVRRTWLRAAGLAAAAVLALFVLLLLLGFLIALSPDGQARIQALADELGVTLPASPAVAAAADPTAESRSASSLGWAFTVVGRLLPHFLRERLAFPWLTLFLAAFLTLCLGLLRLSGRRTSPEAAAGGAGGDSALPLVVLMVAAGVLLTLVPEFVYLRDVFGQRLNTIFKFYYQAWVMFGLAAVAGLDYLIRRSRGVGALAAGLYGLLLVVSLLFPAFAVSSRASEYRGPASAAERAPATLDGIDYVRRGTPDEHAALMWLRDNASVSAVVVEAVGGQYTGFGRVSANTGLPTILGWAGHEYQWRGATPEPAAREPAVQQIFSTVSLEEAAAILDRYDVSYIYVGPLERATYDPAGAGKFAQYLEPVFESGQVTIYRWREARTG